MLAVGKFARPAFARVAVPEVESLGGVFAMVQDQQGFLWFGGKNGLARYDGYQVQLFRHDPADAGSLSSNDISDLLVDREGRLWVATLSGGGLNRFDAQTQTFVRYSYRPEDPYSLGSNAIYALAEDSRGDLWLATHDDGLNRLEHQTGRFHHYPRPVPGLSDVSVRDIAIDQSDNIWAATNADGLYRIQAQGTETQHYRHDPQDEQSLADDHLYSVYIDDYGNVWAGGWKQGLSRLDHATGRFTRFQHDPSLTTSLGAGQIWDIAQDSAGNLWVATGNGALNRFNKWQNQFERFYPEEYVSNALAGAVIRFYLDRAGDLWLGTYNSAVNRISDRGAQFKILRHNPADPDSLLSSVVYALAQNAEGKLWIGTERGLSLLDPTTGDIRHWWHDPQRPDSLPKAPIRALAVDGEDRLWLGTAGMGVWYLEADGQRFQRVPQTLLQDDRIWAISAASNGDIWIGTQAAGLAVYDPSNGTIRRYHHDPARGDSLSHDFVWSLLHDSRGDLWVGTQVGLNRLPAGADAFQRYLHSQDRTRSLGDNSVRALAEDRQGNLWIGTPSSLNQWRADTGDFSVFRTVDGLADDNVTSVVVDDQGFVWSATQRGLARLDLSDRSFRNFDSRHGVAGNAHPRKSAALRGRDGTLYFAGASGVTVLNPFTVQTNLYKAPTRLTGLWINNQQVSLGSVLPRHISLVDRLELSHRQNVFALEFAYLSYLVPEQNQYAYQLVGFDKDWQIVGSDRRRATYTNLDAGHYRFLVKGANNDGLWSDEAVQLHIHIRPPWWRTFPAYTGYLLLAVVAGYALAIAIRRRRRVERLTTKRLREKDHLKAHFLSDIEQRMKVPVEANISLLDGLIRSDEGDSDPRMMQSLDMLRRNSVTLAQVAGELGDFAAIDEGTMESLARGMPTRALDLAVLVDTTMAWFDVEARAKSINLYKTIPDNLPAVFANAVQLQQILYCLIDNALAFTGHGYVEVSANVLTPERPAARRQVLVQVRDTGRGMNQAELDSLWSRLERRQRRDSDLDLVRARRLVALQGGELQVQSTPQKGSIFGFTLPIAE